MKNAHIKLFTMNKLPFEIKIVCGDVRVISPPSPMWTIIRLFGIFKFYKAFRKYHKS